VRNVQHRVILERSLSRACFRGLLVAVAALFVAEGCSDSTAPGPIAATWILTADFYRGKNGKTYTYNCPPNGVAGNVWGTDIYTDDSSICTAAVHAGKFTLISGGTVTIEIRPGENGYFGSTRNGITSSTFTGFWLGSFIFR